MKHLRDFILESKEREAKWVCAIKDDGSETEEFNNRLTDCFEKSGAKSILVYKGSRKVYLDAYVDTLFIVEQIVPDLIDPNRMEVFIKNDGSILLKNPSLAKEYYIVKFCKLDKEDVPGDGKVKHSDLIKIKDF